MRPVPPGSRRRATLALGEKSGVALGYRRARSYELIDIEVCPVLSPRIVERLLKLKPVLAPLLGGRREARVGATETDSGLDIVVEGVRPSAASLGAFAGKAASIGVARLTVDGESIGQVAAPEIDLSGAKVKLPAGAFLQASSTLVGLVRDGAGGAKRVADLFGAKVKLPAGAFLQASREAESTLVGRGGRRQARRRPLRRPRHLHLRSGARRRGRCL